MIIVRTPVRITLGGGGTDLASYYEKHGGFILSAAIDKYIYIALNKRFEESIRVSYSKTEIVNNVKDIEHPIVRESLKLMGIEKNIEIVSIADIPSQCGLGTSSSFTVGVLNALHTYKRQNFPPRALADEACKLEIDILKEPIGKQDQYLAAFGGITCLNIDKKGNVEVEPLKISFHTAAELENHIMIFYTGIRRSASKILKHQKEAGEKDDSKVISALHAIKQIGLEIKEALENGDLKKFGQLLHTHWETKKNLSGKVSSDQMNNIYETALKTGAYGGKIMGAGGGGFFMFYCDHGKDILRKEMEKLGLNELRFRFDYEGSKVIANI